MNKNNAYSSGISKNGLPYVKIGDNKEPLVIFTSASPDNSAPKGFSLSMFVDGAKALSEFYTVYYIKRKQNMPEGYTTKNMADDYAEMIKEEIGKPCNIIGISAGGFISEYFAVNYPELVKKLIITIAGYRLIGKGRERVLLWKKHIEQKQLRKLLASMYTSVSNNKLINFFSVIMAYTIGTLISRKSNLNDFNVLIDALLSHNAKSILSDIKCPVLLIGGEEDMFYPPEILKEMDKDIPDSKLLIYPLVGHGLIEFRKKDFENDVISFLQISE